MSKILYGLGSLNTLLQKEKTSKVCIVTSGILVKKLEWAIREIKFSGIKVIIIPDGEKAKEWNELQKLLKKFIECNLDRKSIIVALGGGTIGDVAGFASSIYLRGIRYVQVPTTLLAQVDSAHGGKTGINFLNYKNQIGSFNLPFAVVIENRFIKSLAREQIIDGLGEIIKYGFIKDSSILELLEKETLKTLIQSRNLQKIIEKSIKVKQYYVNTDLRDNSVRQLLNVGHTIGHAIELKYKISHGRAVILGMLQEFAYTQSLTLTKPSVREYLVNLLTHMEIEIGKELRADWKILLHDKKITGNKIILPVIFEAGKAKLTTLNLEAFKKII